MRCRLIAILILFSFNCLGQSVVLIRITEDGNQVINKNIYGQFAEHLGDCIYNGLWVGKDSKIKNVSGYRADVLDALKKLKIPVLRWPGGCFADDYHWMNGIGPVEKRPKMLNNNWLGVLEDNSFGTHEFLNLCELLKCEPYLVGNVGSGSVEELSNWIEYINSASNSPMANLRRQNGRDKPWDIKYLGVGNESWGCGGSMLPEYYADLYRRYATYCRNYDGNKLFKIACGAGGSQETDYRWTDILMSKVGPQMQGLSIHYYAALPNVPKGWNGSGKSATIFSDEDYYLSVNNGLGIEETIQKHSAIMDKYDKENKIAIIVDEWGSYWKSAEPGPSRLLFQQSSLRDAILASLTLNIFNNHCDRIKMANLAQMVNVLQSLILTEGDQMTCTPTYHVFEMFAVHQDAKYLPIEIFNKMVRLPDGKEIPMISSSASRDKNGVIHISLVNIDLNNSQSVVMNLPFAKMVNAKISGRILTADNITDHNAIGGIELVKPTYFNAFRNSYEKFQVELPAKSVVVLSIECKDIPK